ncbi:MAG: NAD-dependent epimerase/dehydratase family protein [Planctomycetaceae bacterium]|nr:NAD-dependent epimerase/dehydratase family protein [Planctomycetaceae bacterium]
MDASEKVCVIGGTGFIGTVLVRKLLHRGLKVRLLCRNPNLPKSEMVSGGGDSLSIWPHPNIEIIQGDLENHDAVRLCMKGCTYLFHLAGYAKNWASDRSVYERINIQGMRDIFSIARESGIRRTVWTSSIVTLGPTRKNEIGDENMPRITDRYLTEYEKTKSIAEKEALQWAAEGFPVVIVNPTRVYGPGKLTEGNALTRLIDDYDRGKAPVLLNAGVNVGNYVLVEDVAEGHLLAMEKGHLGERYILGGENASLGEFLRTIDKISGKRHFKIPIFRPGALVFAIAQKKRAQWFGIYPRITPGWVRTFLVNWAYSTQKAEKELGYSPTPLWEGLTRTYHWLLDMRKKQEIHGRVFD